MKSFTSQQFPKNNPTFQNTQGCYGQNLKVKIWKDATLKYPTTVSFSPLLISFKRSKSFENPFSTKNLSILKRKLCPNFCKDDKKHGSLRVSFQIHSIHFYPFCMMFFDIMLMFGNVLKSEWTSHKWTSLFKMVWSLNWRCWTMIK